MTSNNQLLNFINGTWTRSAAGEALNIMNPATAQVLTTVPLSPGAEVDAAVQAAQTAFADWRHTPVVDRIQPLFRLKMLLEEHIDECDAEAFEMTKAVLDAMLNVAPPTDDAKTRPVIARADSQGDSRS